MIKNNLVSGLVEVEPVLAPGSAADTGSLYVTVWAAANQSRISTATVTATNPNGASVSVPELRNGVYALPVLRAGSYDLRVSAFGFGEQELTVELAAGELGSHIVALVQAEVKPGGPLCYGDPGAPGGLGWADALLIAGLVGGLLMVQRKRTDTTHTPS